MPLRKAAVETVLDLSPDALAKFAAAEELRLVASKMDRLWNAIEAKIPLQEEFIVRFREMKEATIELQRARRNLKRKYNVRRKEVRNKRTKREPALDQLQREEDAGSAERDAPCIEGNQRSPAKHGWKLWKYLQKR